MNDDPNQSLKEFMEQNAEEIEAVQIESEDIRPDLQRVVNRTNFNDPVEVAAIIHALSGVLVDTFVQQSVRNGMTAEAAVAHWSAITMTLTFMVHSKMEEKRLN